MRPKQKCTLPQTSLRLVLVHWRPPSKADGSTGAARAGSRGCMAPTHLDERVWWIQVSRDGDESACVVLRCSPRATVEQAAAVLGHWQPTTTLSLHVLNVMSIA
jgi:hypothetical protein